MTGAAWDDDAAHLDGARARDRRRRGRRCRRARSSRAVGQLNRPHLPDIPGRSDFAGPAFHSARWDHSVDLRGKRVAMIGAGRQRLPDRARRSPSDVDAPHGVPAHRAVDVPEPELPRRGRPGRAVGAAAPAVLRPLVPVPDVLAGLRRRPRRGPGRPGLPGPADARSARSTTSPGRCSPTGSRSQVGDDPDLLAKVVPDYPATGKRTLQDNGSWLRTLTRDDVDLVRDGIDHIEADAVVTDDGDAPRGRRDRVRHRVPGQPAPVADDSRRPRRRGPRRAVGRAAVGVPRHHGARTSRTSSACTAPARTSPTAAA